MSKEEQALEYCDTLTTDVGTYEVFWNTVSGHIHVRNVNRMEDGFTISAEPVSKKEQAIEFASLPKRQ